MAVTETRHRLGHYISIQFIYDPTDPFFSDKLGVGVQHISVAGNEGIRHPHFFCSVNTNVQFQLEYVQSQRKLKMHPSKEQIHMTTLDSRLSTHVMKAMNSQKQT